MNRESVDLMPYNMWLVSTPFIVQQTTSLPQMTSVPLSVQSSTAQGFLSKEHNIQCQSNDMTQFQTALKNLHSKSSTSLHSPKDKKNILPRLPPHSTFTVDEHRTTPIKQEVISGVPCNGVDGDIFQGPHMLSKTVCKICGKWFRSRQQLTQHQLVHTDIRKYRCNFCDRAFKQPSHLQQHHRIHTGEKPYRCPLEGCTRAFPQLSNLNHHLRNHDKPDPPTENTCKFCGRMYASEAVLKNHMLKIHMSNGDFPLGDIPKTASSEPATPGVVGSVTQLDHVTKAMFMREHQQFLSANGHFNEEMVKNMQNAFQIFNIPHKKPKLSEESRISVLEEQHRHDFSPDAVNGSSLDRKPMMQPPLMHAMSPEVMARSDSETKPTRRKGAPAKIVPGSDIMGNGLYGKVNLNEHLHDICVRENYNYTLDTPDHSLRIQHAARGDKEVEEKESSEADLKHNGVTHDNQNDKTEFAIMYNDKAMMNAAYRYENGYSRRDENDFDSVQYVRDNLQRYETMMRDTNNFRRHHDNENVILIERSRDGPDLDEESPIDSDSQHDDSGDDDVCIVKSQNNHEDTLCETKIKLNVQTSNSRKRKAFQPQRVVYDQEPLDFSA